MTKVIKSPYYSFGSSCFGYTTNYFHETTFHGLRHIVTPKRHWLEVLLWSVIVVSASSLAGWIMYRNYVRYQTDPVVISLYKNFRTWNVTFPASTLCFMDKFDKEKGAALIERKWGLLEDDKDFPYYLRFLQAVANSSYYSFGAFAEFVDDAELNKENLTLLMDQVSFELDNMTVTLYNKEDVFYNKTMLEMGICFSVNSLITLDLVPDSSVLPQVNESEKWHPQYCLYLNLVCYGVKEFLERAVYYYVHSPHEIPEVNSKAYYVQYLGYRETTFNHLDILSSSRIRGLTPEQRECYFYDESRYNNLRYYSYNLCKIQCRRELAMKFCKCVPHFYMKQDDQPQCTIKQLQCIDKHKDELIHLKEIKGGKSVKICNNCYQACEEVNYYEEEDKITLPERAEIRITKYHWSIENYSKTRYKREIIFGVEDLLTSLGGTAGFFLGCSLMSGVELIYFFTLRLIRYCKSKPKLNQKTEQPKRNVENLPTYLSHPSTKTYSNHWDMAKQHSIKIARQRRQAFVSYY